MLYQFALCVMCVCTCTYIIGSFVNANFPRKLQFNDSSLVCTIVLYSEKFSTGLVFMDTVLNLIELMMKNRFYFLVKVVNRSIYKRYEKNP